MIMRNGAKRCNEVVRVEGKMSVKQTEGNVNSRVRCICNDGCNRNPYSEFGSTSFHISNHTSKPLFLCIYSFYC